ncbi:hypothetical protein ACJMK2_012621 [Sinanodonta woodiana]|uniref:Sodium/glucose cotransporter 4 n=1 Tax=Sinanodonta woodiana TaxID=1069815 RepID=A0ABD3VAR2_SINWO
MEGLNHWGDILVVVLYFVFVLIVCIWSMLRRNRGSLTSYFLAGRSIPWWPVGASLFSSNIGSEHFIGLAGTGATSGIAIVLYEWLAMPLLIMMAWLFIPVYISAGKRDFGGQRIRLYLSVLAIVLYIVTKLAVSIFAGALFIQMSLGWNMYVSIVALLITTGLYTVLGGLAAVIYTDTLQTAVMVIGALILVGKGFGEVGGYDNLKDRYFDSVASVRVNNSSCGYPRDDAFHILRHPVHSDSPWPGMLLQASIGVMWYFCCDQVIVQRSLAAKNMLHAKCGAIMAGYLKILPFFIMILPGMISRALFPDEIACVDKEECLRYCGNPVGCSNIAYPRLVMGILPAGLRGLLMAVMLSAIMSSLTSIFNSASTIFTMDLWQKIRNVLWIPLLKTSQSGQLFIYIQSVQGYLGTPIGPVFLLAILWKRTTEQGAFWGMLIGHICGIIRMSMDFAYHAPDCGEPETRPPVLYKVHYTYFGQMSLVITALAVVVISLLTVPREESDLCNLTWWTRAKYKEEESDNDIEEHELSDLSSPSYDIERIGKLRLWCDKICGIPEDKRISPGLPHSDICQRKFLYENPFWKKIVNLNAILGVTVIAFLIGYYR